MITTNLNYKMIPTTVSHSHIITKAPIQKVNTKLTKEPKEKKEVVKTGLPKTGLPKVQDRVQSLFF